jgi:hypothetical protein
MAIDWNSATNPFLDLCPEVYARDPLLHYHDGVFRCFHTAAEQHDGNYRLFLDVTQSTDLIHWSAPTRLTTSELGFSSPGSIIQVGDEWVMSVQSYPIPEGQKHADETARLWLMTSLDLDNWSDPEPIKPDGAQVNWTESHRQIDPCLIEHDGRYWCFYKTGGRLGLLVSDDLEHWVEASPDRPVLGPGDTPDHSGVENPCVVRDGDGFTMFFAPCRQGRGIGVARSDDLLHWYDVRYLDFPSLPWADGGPTAAMVADLRDVCDKWVMVFHGERPGPHAAALGIAYSDDLEHWTVAPAQ